MYNRYIPQPDGSFRRSRIQNDAPRPSAPPRYEPPQEQSCPPKPEPRQQENCSKPAPCPRSRQRSTRPQPVKQDSPQAASFLKNLLPKDFDTSDLMIVLLLLLMAGDGPDDQNNALLTLALYFFM